ncbi:MAG: hypothetical protein CMO55_02500 [Verrucomicrobiales bacterium]|nr:hypothetical protein [Verrucomicrobiales bacterium]
MRSDRTLGSKMKANLSVLLFFPIVFAVASCETTNSTSSSATTSAAVSSSSDSSASSGVKPYPKKKCLVTGEALDSKGQPITEVYQGQEVKFCCEPCRMAFHMNPSFYMAKL